MLCTACMQESRSTLHVNGCMWVMHSGVLWAVRGLGCVITDLGNARACTLSTARSYMLGAAKVGMPEVNAASWR